MPGSFIGQRGGGVEEVKTITLQISSWMADLRELLCCVALSCPTLCDPMDCSQPGFSIHGILQARMLEWVAMPFSRGSSQPRDQTQVSCIGGLVLHQLSYKGSPASGRGYINFFRQRGRVPWGRSLRMSVVVQSLNQSCLTLCDPMDCSMLGFPVLHCLPEFYQTPVHWVQWCHPTISSSIAFFSCCPKSFPASGSFLMSWLFPSGGQSIGALASASALPVNIQGWFP